MKNRNGHSLEFPCECVSAKGGYSDPWSPVAQKKLLPDGTKEDILNMVAHEPRTVAQLAKLLNRSQPSILAHVNEMMTSELLRESDEWEKKYPAERYYEPNFPIIPLSAQAEFEAICGEMAKSFEEIFEKNLSTMKSAFAKTELPSDGWEFADIVQYFYAKAQRRARKMLEERGTLPMRQQHQNGIAWLFWAEERESNGKE